jgi:hypothetical protein
MKKSFAMIVMVMSMTAAGTAAMAAEPAYIPWTFDDFDSNCNVVETAAEPAYIPWTFDDFDNNGEVIETAEAKPVEL